MTSKANQGDFMKEDIRETMKLAKEAGAIEGSDEHYIAIRLFVKSENRVVFMSTMLCGLYILRNVICRRVYGFCNIIILSNLTPFFI
jgi:hypothetical protein